MAQCVAVQPDGALVASQSQELCDYVLLTNAELQQLSDTSLVNTLTELFAFDAQLFAAVHAWALATFILAHGVGRTVRTLGKG